MGHHAKTADEMAYTNAREEAKGKRQQKKAKSKKARLAAEGREKQEEIDDDQGPDEDEFGNPILPEPTEVRSKMVAVIASMERSFSTIRGGEATPEMFDAMKSQ